MIGSRIKQVIKVEYAYQELSNIPEAYQSQFKERTKPWGTGQAILCCKDLIHEPFLVINADDYYGQNAFKEAYQYLTQEHSSNKEDIAMVSFILKNTLSDNGGVTRGLCHVDQNHYLTDIVETHNIEKGDGYAFVRNDDHEDKIDWNSFVSMNMWAFQPTIFKILNQEFDQFLKNVPVTDLKQEFLLPTIVGDLLKNDRATVKVLSSPDNWFGVTYQEDKQIVIDSIKELVENHTYPKHLY